MEFSRFSLPIALFVEVEVLSVNPVQEGIFRTNHIKQAQPNKDKTLRSPILPNLHVEDYLADWFEDECKVEQHERLHA